MINTYDSFLSDDDADDDTCPLCVEELDLSDKNFKPCPCGYQICQFCYNNIRQNPDLNGRCPACRRPYDDESVEYKQLTAEEWKLEQNKQSKREKEKRQKEKEKKEFEQLNRKHLSGMRVIQKNLVYIVGLNPPVAPEDLHAVLRSEKYFGQFGKILKIVVNKRNPITGHYNPGATGVGVYVTFSKKEEAAKCITAVDGSYMDGKPLKAAFGTTKYCSSYLRGQGCPNPNCMFLHEPGEEADSYTRQDLSTRQSLKMGGAEGYKIPAPFPKNAPYVDDSHSSSNMSSPAASSNTPLSTSASTHPLAGSAPLPASASWASKNGTIVPQEQLAEDFNSTAFPTLSDILKQQQQQQQQTLQQHQHQQHQLQPQKKQKNQAQHVDEFNPEGSFFNVLDETLNDLSSSAPFRYEIRHDVLTDSVLSCPPLFSFARRENAPMYDREFNLNLIKTFMAKTIRPHTVAPPQQLVAPAIQPQAVPQNGTPALVQAQLNNLLQQQQQQHQQQQHQHQLHQQQQQQQRVNSQTQQQQFFTQQQLLQQQLLQQQVASQHAHTPSQQNQPLNMAAQQLLHEQMLQQNGVKERSFANTPPPGIFAANQNAEQNVGGTASELLSHLLNGKKISA